MKRLYLSALLVVFLCCFFGFGIVSSADAPSQAQSLSQEIIGVETSSYGEADERIDALFIERMPTKNEYLSFDSFDFSGLVIKAVYENGEMQNVGGDKLSYTYQRADSFRFGDSYVLGEYEGKIINIPVSVKKRSYDITSVSFLDKEYVFSGEETSIFQEGVMPIGLDGIALSYEVLGSGRDVGIYPIVLTFKTESSEYETPSSIERTLTIIPYECNIMWDRLSFVYDGEYKIPSGYYIDVDGRVVSAKTVGGGVNAGAYTVLAIPTDSNYKFVGASVDFEIERALYDMSNVSWTDEGFIYDGAEKSVFVSGLPNGVFVCEYVDNVKRTAGSYTAIARLSYDADNYEYPGDLSYSWEIKKADIDLSGVYWSDGEFYYDGNEKRTEINGLPSEITLLGYKNNGKINSGEYEIIPIVSYDSENYNEPLLPNGKITIKKCPVSIPSVSDYTYSKKEIILDLPLSDIYFATYEKKKDAGNYFVRFELYDYMNYEFVGGGYTAWVPYKILPQVISVKVSDVEKYLFEKESAPTFTLMEGEVFYADNLLVSYYKNGDKIYCVSENPNYMLEVIPGNVIERNTLSARGYLFMAFLAIAAISFFLLLTVLIVNRKRVVYVSQKAHIESPLNTNETHKECKAVDVKNEDDAHSGQSKTLKVECDCSNDTEKSKYSDKAEDRLFSESGELPNDLSNFTTPKEVTPINEERADSLISDSLAKDLLYKNGINVYTNGTRRQIVNVDTLSRSFAAGDRIDVNILKEKDLIPYDTRYIKILARGVIDKPLTVYANDFSLAAIKMIALTGGASFKVNSLPKIKKQK